MTVKGKGTMGTNRDAQSVFHHFTPSIRVSQNIRKDGYGFASLGQRKCRLCLRPCEWPPWDEQVRAPQPRLCAPLAWSITGRWRSLVCLPPLLLCFPDPGAGGQPGGSRQSVMSRGLDTLSRLWTVHTAQTGVIWQLHPTLSLGVGFGGSQASPGDRR